MRCVVTTRLAVLAGLAVGCGSSEDPEHAVVHRYAINLRANYHDVVVRLQALRSAVDAFVDQPTSEGLEACRQAWLDARPGYGACEVSRFYGGPIDAAQGRMNEWPIDENFIDYTIGNPNGGIINDPAGYPQLTPQVLAAADERGGIENLSSGFHALEFLLWGQRRDQSEGPGQRPFTDFVDGGTAANQDRRRTYLSAATQLLLSDMTALEAEWDPANATGYGAGLLALPGHTGVARIMRGFSNMVVAELYYERLDDPVITGDRKDEESCFSESTGTDLVANALGVENVYLGRYGDLHGPGLTDLVRAEKPALDAAMRQQLAAVRAALGAIPPPFDHAVLAPATSEAHQAVQTALDAFPPLIESLRQVADVLGVPINV